MKKISVIGATLVAAAVLCAAPISLHQSQDKGLSLSVDKAQALIGRYAHGGSYPSQAAAPLTCKGAAKLQFPTDAKARHAYRHECKQAWKAQKKAAKA
jgi:hypothetical protein